MIVETAVLEITDKCNLNCAHCMNRPDSKAIEVDTESISQVLSKLADYGTKKIYVSGGEPLVHSSIESIIDLTKDYTSIDFIITTNGLLLTPEIIELIEKHPNVTLQFSIDGISPQSYEAMRGEKTFDRFLNAIELWDHCSKQKGFARTCLTKHNYRELPNIFDFCLRHRLSPSFLFVGALGNGKDNWKSLELNLGQKMWCIDTINKLNEKYNTTIGAPEAPASCNFTLKTGVGAFIIRADGSVAPCQFFYDISLGNIYTDEIDSILNNSWIKEHCDIAAQRKDKLSKSEKCNNCKIKDGCDYGCIALAAELGDIMGYDGLCEMRVITTLCYSNKLITYRNPDTKRNAVHIEKE